MTKNGLINKFNFIFWDFDGVLLNSMSIRDIGFIEVLKGYSKPYVDELLKYHNQNGGLSRYHKFRYFFESILKEPYTDKIINNMAEDFSVIMKNELVNKNLLIQKPVNFIENTWQKINHCIVSGSDQNELRFLCKKLGIYSYFTSIYGSPTPKNKLVELIMQLEQLNIERTCLIGDSKNDLEAAKVNGISFFGFNYTGNEKITKITFV